MPQYAIWLIPAEKPYEKLNDKLLDLAKKHASKYLEPHVTLISGLEGEEADMIKKTTKFIKKISPISLRLTKIESGGDELKCVFIVVDDDEELSSWRSNAEELFNKEPSDYMPHMSLIYGRFISYTKDRIIREIGKNYDQKIFFDKAMLYETTGEYKTWHKIKEFKLSKK